MHKNAKYSIKVVFMTPTNTMGVRLRFWYTSVNPPCSCFWSFNKNSYIQFTFIRYGDLHPSFAPNLNLTNISVLDCLNDLPDNIVFNPLSCASYRSRYPIGSRSMCAIRELSWDEKILRKRKVERLAGKRLCK